MKIPNNNFKIGDDNYKKATIVKTDNSFDKWKNIGFPNYWSSK